MPVISFLLQPRFKNDETELQLFTNLFLVFKIKWIPCGLMRLYILKWCCQCDSRSVQEMAKVVTRLPAPSSGYCLYLQIYCQHIRVILGTSKRWRDWSSWSKCHRMASACITWEWWCIFGDVIHNIWKVREFSLLIPIPATCLWYSHRILSCSHWLWSKHTVSRFCSAALRPCISSFFFWIFHSINYIFLRTFVLEPLRGSFRWE